MHVGLIRIDSIPGQFDYGCPLVCGVVSMGPFGMFSTVGGCPATVGVTGRGLGATPVRCRYYAEILVGEPDR
jgi:hypothetical protein